MAEQFKTVSSVAVADVGIAPAGRLRPVSEAGVLSLMASIGELGVMKDPIHVRRVPHRGGALELMAGGHRLEAARRLGWESIPAKVWTCTDDWAHLMEIDDNLGGAELGALDTAVFLAARKKIFEKLHPEAASSAFKGNQHTGTLLVRDIVSFTRTTSEKFDLSKRQVERLVAAGLALSPNDLPLLRAAPRAVTLKDLGVLAKVGDPAERDHVIGALAQGKARSAAEARRQFAERDMAPAPAEDPIDAAFLKLHELWSRTPKKARRRFVSAAHRELADLLAQEAPET